MALPARAVAVAVLCVSLTGCGSTVRVTGSATTLDQGLGEAGGALAEVGIDPSPAEVAPSGGSPSTGGTLGGSSGTVDGASSGSDGTTGTTVTSGSGTTGPTGTADTSGTPAATTGSGGSTTGGSATSTTANGLGVTDKTITVGVTVTSNGDAANSAIGASGITQGDARANIKALVDEINAAGGVAGRQLVAVVHAYDAQSTQSGATQDGAACSDFTEDHEVMAVFSTGLTDLLPQCLKKAGVVQFASGGLVGKDKAFTQTYPASFQLGTMTQERILKDTVGALSRQNYFTGWNTLTGRPAIAPVKLAVISYDGASFKNAVTSTLLPGLRAAGHPVDSTNVFYILSAESQAGVGSQAAAIKSATLRMQQDGVTHLVFNDANGLLLGLFATNAQSQQFFPRFGVTSGAGPQAIYDSGLVKAEQLNGMAGNGWLPTLDLPAADGSKLATEATARCLEIMKRRTGQTYTSTNAASIALIECDNFFLLVEALGRAPSLSPTGLVAGMEAIGGTYTSALLPASFLSAQQHDNAVRAFDLNWVASCTCVRYSSPRSVPS